jgi:GNAT superfamily N-acetyltransferase
MDQPIDVSGETTAAFVGRALRGPLNTPILVRNFGEFRRRFGDIWSGSSLGPAVKQFFEHGGHRLYIVRVANNARGAMLCLPAGGSALVLRAVEPGSTEKIRAAVDYDGLEDDADLFNLALQRLDPVTGLITDQELLSGLSFHRDAESFVGRALADSSLARAEAPYPSRRPDETLKGGRQFESDYIDHAQPGTDGAELTDYDLVGARAARSGLFALQQAESFDVLYLPPPRRQQDLGPAVILAAERYCRERGAMLVVDPRVEWTTTARALQGVRDLGFCSSHLLGYFPRVTTQDDAATPRAIGGAIAGLLCKHDRTRGAWQRMDRHGMVLARNLRPAVDFDERDREALIRAGLNPVVRGAAGMSRFFGDVTFGRVGDSHREFASLPVQRFCLQVLSSIARAARWSVFELEDATLAKTLRAQVVNFFERLAERGALADDRFVVECDAGVSQRTDVRSRGVTLLLVFRPVNSPNPVSFTLHLRPEGWQVGSTAFAPTIENCA